MTNASSKLAYSCAQYVHPWTDDCYKSIVGVLLQGFGHSVRIYSVVYLLSLLMKQRIPTQRDVKKSVLGMIQSSAFLTTNAAAFFMFVCILRNVMGRFTCGTLSFYPAFLSSLAAILIERPVRRPLLCLYVSNVATESIWRMMESRGYVNSLPNGQVLIFGISVSILLFVYRLGIHKGVAKDSLFDILRMFVGKTEEGPIKIYVQPSAMPQPESSSSINFTSFAGLVQIYTRFVDRIKKRNECCPHRGNCIKYAIMGGIRPLIGGIGLQILLKLILSIRKIVQLKLNMKKVFFNKSIAKLGVFLGGFSFLFKAVSCCLRHIVGQDHPLFALPAGFVASTAFFQYPDVTVALYVWWKMLQIVYNIGIDQGVVPKVPGFTIFLYCLSTATLFQAAIFEPKNLRSSYWKFLQGLSGYRLAHINREVIDVFGLNTSEAVGDILKKTGDLGEAVKFAMA